MLLLCALAKSGDDKIAEYQQWSSNLFLASLNLDVMPHGQEKLVNQASAVDVWAVSGPCVSQRLRSGLQVILEHLSG